MEILGLAGREQRGGHEAQPGHSGMSLRIESIRIELASCVVHGVRSRYPSESQREQIGIKFPENRENNRDFLKIIAGFRPVPFQRRSLKQPFDRKQQYHKNQFLSITLPGAAAGRRAVNCDGTGYGSPTVVFRQQPAIDQAPDGLTERRLVRLLRRPFLDLPPLFGREAQSDHRRLAGGGGRPIRA
jgi:hypothetical protein